MRNPCESEGLIILLEIPAYAGITTKIIGAITHHRLAPPSPFGKGFNESF